ncbi:uroporphyrinogen-III synthase [Actinobacillus ureae ATCC 25976]|uniref:Uroporphyrinogen-III synthase n=1 Tax=Actinobacillus ureae ATCC 25976 TaxID=887324 RepID=E8KG63_9PAST|nr:uroporphyrinogen-III synthase [Actinobacillus ureae]EFX92115.1 uroporphyrinogen-III synthase [Actinobacillus ureae ATCC 25976]
MNVLITRPDHRGQELVDMLNQHQIFAIHQPLFTIEAGTELPQLPSVMARLNAGDYVFAVSKQAIDFASATLEQTGFHYRADLNYFAVGQQSAQYFSSRSEQPVRYPIVSENSDGLLLLDEMQDLNGKNLLILRAETGRDLLAETAVSRGAEVQYLECYRRKYVEENIVEKISLCKRVGVDTIVVTSGDILTTLYEQTAEEDRGWLSECRLIVVSQRIANMAYKLGWEQNSVILSEKADNNSLLETVLNAIEKSN